MAPDWGAAFFSEVDGLVEPQGDKLYETEAHVMYRYHPGPGSYAMSWVIQREHAWVIRWTHNCGRTAAVFLEYRRRRWRVLCVGVHGPHDAQTLTDARAWRANVPHATPVITVGGCSINEFHTFGFDELVRNPEESSSSTRKGAASSSGAGCTASASRWSRRNGFKVRQEALGAG